MPRHVLVCAAWPYANSVMHLGHVAGYLLPADIFARFHRMLGHEVVFVSGSDEHGTPIMLAAERSGESPAVIAQRYHGINSGLMVKYQISFDKFSRTSDPNHKKVVGQIFQTLLTRGYIYKAPMKAMYCPKDQAFRADRYIEGTCPHCAAPDARGDQCDNCGKILDALELKDPRCKVCGTTPEVRETEHFFLALSKFEEPIATWLETRKGWRPQVINFTRSFVKGGLQDRPITRDLPWGVEIPLAGYEGKRIYVWFEALLGYVSATREWAAEHSNPSKWRDFWTNPEAETHYFLGKDNIPFHTVILPAVLMGLAEYNLPTNVPANEYLLFQGAKFSKSKGVGLTMEEYLEIGEVAALRYYLAMNMPELKDVEADWDDFVAKNNTELLGNLGNFVNRTLTLVYRHVGTVPVVGASAHPDELDHELARRIEETAKRAGDLIAAAEFKNALREIMALSQFGNQYIDRKAPWKLAQENPEANLRALFEATRLVRALAIMLAPFVPDKAQLIWQGVGETGEVTKARWTDALSLPVESRKIPEPHPIIKPIDPASFKPAARAAAPPLEERPLARVDLRAARIESVTPHPKADKLYLVRVDLGDHARQVIAGLRKEYEAQELRGKTCVVVANLEPAKLRGELSEGMLLAAESGPVVSILVAPGAAAGANVEGSVRGAKPLSIKEFQEVPLVTATSPDGKVLPAVSTAHGPEFLRIAGKHVGLDREVPAGFGIH